MKVEYIDNFIATVLVFQCVALIILGIFKYTAVMMTAVA